VFHAQLFATADDKARLSEQQLAALEQAVAARAAQAEVVKGACVCVCVFLSLSLTHARTHTHTHTTLPLITGLKAQPSVDKAAVAAAVEQLGRLTAGVEVARRV